MVEITVVTSFTVPQYARHWPSVKHKRGSWIIILILLRRPEPRLEKSSKGPHARPLTHVQLELEGSWFLSKACRCQWTTAERASLSSACFFPLQPVPVNPYSLTFGPSTRSFSLPGQQPFGTQLMGPLFQKQPRQAFQVDRVP